eukprot:gene29059-36045_t
MTNEAPKLIKKEKDFEKLQNQYAKVVKDTQKVQKSVMTISVPLKKNLSQTVSSVDKSAAIWMKDGEVIAARNKANAIEIENKSLRSALETFQQNMSELSAQFDQALLLSEATNETAVEAIRRENSLILREKDSIIDALSLESAENKAKIQTITAQYRAITLAQREEAMRAAQSAPSTPKTPAVLASEKSEITETYLQGTPSAVARYVSTTPSTAARKYLKTPGIVMPAVPYAERSRGGGCPVVGTIAGGLSGFCLGVPLVFSLGTASRPTVTWMVNEVDTEVKRLRERVDDIVYLKTHQPVNSTEADGEGIEFSDNNVF